MRITSFTPNDFHPFLALARDEGWISTRRELAYLLEHSPEGCLVYHDEDNPVGFVTALCHNRSGWIGNLLVSHNVRGRGIGTALFRRALEVLQRSGATTIWLTASRAGRPIYEQCGFRSCDRIQRWERPGKEQGQAPIGAEIMPGWFEIDLLGWGDARNELLAHAAHDGAVIGEEDGFLMLQRLGNGYQIGPFGALNSFVAEGLLDKALQATGRVVIDTPAANQAATQLLASRGFAGMSEVELMYAGQSPAYRPEYIFGLASMGSMG